LTGGCHRGPNGLLADEQPSPISRFVRPRAIWRGPTHSGATSRRCRRRARGARVVTAGGGAVASGTGPGVKDARGPAGATTGTASRASTSSGSVISARRPSSRSSRRSGRARSSSASATAWPSGSRASARTTRASVRVRDPEAGPATAPARIASALAHRARASRSGRPAGTTVRDDRPQRGIVVAWSRGGTRVRGQVAYGSRRRCRGVEPARPRWPPPRPACGPPARETGDIGDLRRSSASTMTRPHLSAVAAIRATRIQSRAAQPRPARTTARRASAGRRSTSRRAVAW